MSSSLSLCPISEFKSWVIKPPPHRRQHRRRIKAGILNVLLITKSTQELHSGIKSSKLFHFLTKSWIFFPILISKVCFLKRLPKLSDFCYPVSKHGIYSILMKWYVLCHKPLVSKNSHRFYIFQCVVKYTCSWTQEFQIW